MIKSLPESTPKRGSTVPRDPEGDKGSPNTQDTELPQGQPQRTSNPESAATQGTQPVTTSCASSQPGIRQYPLVTLIAHWLTTIFTGLAFAAAAYYAYQAKAQVSLMSETLGQTKRVADSAFAQAAAIPTQIRDIEDANRIARSSASDALAQARRANQIAEENIRESERPWVGVGPIDILAKPLDGQAVKIRITILNGGRSPAIHSNSYALFNTWVYPRGDSRIPLIDDPSLKRCRGSKPKWANDAGGTTILPGVTNVTVDLHSPIVNKPQVDLLLNPEHFLSGEPRELAITNVPRAPAPPNTQQWSFGLFLVGCMNYFDESHAAHRTNWCYFYSPSGYTPNGTFSSCWKGNSAD